MTAFEISVIMSLVALPLALVILLVGMAIVDVRRKKQDEYFHSLCTQYYHKYGVVQGNRFLNECKRMRSMCEVIKALEASLENEYLEENYE